jgi:hypothetical protein
MDEMADFLTEDVVDDQAHVGGFGKDVTILPIFHI